MVKIMSNNINQIKVEDVMLSLDKFPILIHHQLFQEALEAMNKFKHGVGTEMGWKTNSSSHRRNK